MTLTADPVALLAAAAELEDDWALWLAGLFPDHCTYPFGDHHVELWDWLWGIRPGVREDPLVAIFGRGGAKSTTAELGCVSLGARRIRRYGLYVSGVQDQADDHVGSIGSLLENRAVETIYPDLAQREVNKYGQSKGWRRNRLRTKAGFTIDALGLDVAARGAKLDDARPDFIVFDDIDDETDSLATVEKKIKQITRKILPAGSEDVVVLAVQNIVHPDSVIAQLADGRADFLTTRRVLGPIPALRNMEYRQDDRGRFILTRGEPTWLGQDLARCQEQVDDWGFSAFMAEAQHVVDVVRDALFSGRPTTAVEGFAHRRPLLL